jgi:hypothetical protein
LGLPMRKRGSDEAAGSSLACCSKPGAGKGEGIIASSKYYFLGV